MAKEKSTKKLEKSTNRFPVVGIGASAGGLDAFKKLIKAIPEKSGMAYVLVQHLDPRHESMLPDILQKITPIPLSEISEDVKVEPNHIYIIPSNKMLLANDDMLQLSPRSKNKNEKNLPIDLFFASLAEVHQSNAIGVVLSGTASDGTQGLKAIKEYGGLTFAQDEASAQYEGMPQSAVLAGVVDFVLPPERIPAKLIEIVGRISRTDEEIAPGPGREDEVFKQILALLRIRKGTDFTYYKQTTIRRRILRRMALSKHDDPVAYLKFLREYKAELDALYQDLLIPVTGFFRDRATFDNLCETLLPLIVKNKPVGDPVRVWVAGCSTGEEAFSIAICIKEFLNSREYHQVAGPKANNDTRVQIFATDISEPAISKARKGIYSKADIEGLSQEQRQDFFVKSNGNYQVNKVIRDMCIFAVHNFLKDPPFARMDLVSCRNVLIYMEPYLQKKALTTFHYALVPKAFLLLGKSETCGSVPDLFAPYGKNDKLFSRKDVPARYMHVASQRSEQQLRDIDTHVKPEGKLADFAKTADDILLSKFAPAGVVVNEGMEIVHFRGATGSYLEPSPGKASFNLLKMIKEGLAFELRNILHKARNEKVPVIKENIPIEINGERRNVTIEAIPLRNLIEPHYLVLFHESEITPANKSRVTRPKTSRNGLDEKDLRIQQLEGELSQTREDMRTITEDQEAANEELQSANEELLSGSEELQSLNEEMETSKEELQSTNEELIVINQEMISLNEQVTEARNYAEAIVTTIRQPLIIVDKKLRVKSANQAFYKTFMASENDTEGRLFFELGNKQWDIPVLRTVLENIIPGKERVSDYEVKNFFPHIGERTMLLNALELKEEAGREKLILMAIEDITEKRLAENRLSESEKKFRDMADFIPQLIWTANTDGTIDYYNRQWYNFTATTENNSEPGWTNFIHQEDKQKSIAAWLDSVKTGQTYKAEFRLKDKQSDTYRWFMAKASPIKNNEGVITKWFGSFIDIHEQKTAAEQLQKAKEMAESLVNIAEEAVRSKQQFLSNMSHEIRTPMNSIIGFTNVLLRSALTGQQQEYVNAIKTSGDVMTVLINDILDIAKVDAGKMTFEKAPFKLRGAVLSMLNLFEIKLKEKNIALVTNFDARIPKVVSGDAVRLHQVILNLVSNAVKFTTVGKIEINVKLHREDDRKAFVEFSITDTGIGIPEDRLNLVFDYFEQAHTHSSVTSGGSGLGLSIVKKLIEAQGGEIHVKSKMDEGSTFTFILGFEKTTDKIPAAQHGQLFTDEALKDIKALVVEDTPLNQLLMKTSLQDFGFQADIVDNGKIAIEKLMRKLKKGQAGYNIIMMDLQMPGMNGYETTSYIRNQLQLDIPIIAVTADTTQEALERCTAVGMNDYITKPVDEQLLLRKIIELVKKNIPVKKDSNLKKDKIEAGRMRYTNLAYLQDHSKGDVLLMKELIGIYLQQTPALIKAMKESLAAKDWPILKGAAHKLQSSFTIMGFNKKYREMTQEIQDNAGKPGTLAGTRKTIAKIEVACKEACDELQMELDRVNKEH